jgi:hypothetical protein
MNIFRMTAIQESERNLSQKYKTSVISCVTYIYILYIYIYKYKYMYIYTYIYFF